MSLLQDFAYDPGDILWAVAFCGTVGTWVGGGGVGGVAEG